MTDRLTPQREAEIQQRAEAATPGPWEEHTQYGEHFYAYLGGSYLHGVGTLNFGEGEDAEADKALTVNAREDIRALLAELAAVRAERDMYRERALDAENRSIIEGREVCADCERPVPNPCTVHSPDAVFQRAAREAAQLRVDRDRARARVAELRRYVARLEAAICQCEPEREHSDYRRWSDYQHAVDCPAAEIQMRTLGCPGFEGNPVAPGLCAGCHEPHENHAPASQDGAS